MAESQPGSSAAEAASSPAATASAHPRLDGGAQRTVDQELPRSASPTLYSRPSSASSRSRNHSPLARSHLRSRSAASLLTPPAMTRAHSLPVADASGRILMSTTSYQRPPSPLGSNGRYRSPSRRVSEEAAALGIPSLPDIGENVPLDSDMDIAPRPSERPHSQSSPLPGAGLHHTFPRRYRPSSPLRTLPAPTSIPSSSSAPPPRTPRSASPVGGVGKFNESYPAPSSYSMSFLSTSSMPSTPTSLRSRSPSISSLETIPDSPDAEEAAIEAENTARLRAVTENEMDDDSDTSEPKRRTGLEGSGSGRGFGFGSSQKKKRWSVCGAERRGDLDLETIWED